MQQRTLGRSGIDIAPIVFGGNVLGWTADTRRSLQLLERFVERGFNAIDTADMYSSWAPGHSGGESETVLGQWLAQGGRREDIVLMSKVGLWEQRKGLSPANIEAAIDDSLRRLGTDYLDVYFAHIDDPDTPLEDTLGTFDQLIQSGKVRSIGASNYDARRLQVALDISTQQEFHRFEVVQPRYNLHDRDSFEGPLADLALEAGLGVTCYFALASGFLSGKYNRVEDVDYSARAGLLRPYFNPRGERILETLHDVSAQLDASPAQISLAWLLQRPGVTAPIASATSVAQLDEILDAATLSLPSEAIKTLDAASQ